jgi:ABC-type multidrug transport system permease subunit
MMKRTSQKKMNGNLLEAMGYRKRILDCEIRREQKRRHKELFAERRSLFILMDIIVALCIIMNFGAVVTTNILIVDNAVQQGMEVSFAEANKAQSEIHDYEPHPDGSRLIKALLVQALMWAVLLFCYLYFRTRVFDERTLYIMLFAVCFYFVVIGIDFFNNFGYYIAKVMFL